MRPIVNPPPHVYTSLGLDRATPRRKDAAWLAARRADPATLVLPMTELKFPVRQDGPSLDLVTTESEHGRPDVDDIFLGMLEGRAVFAHALTPDEVGDDGERFVELRSVGAVLSAAEASLAAYARGVRHWQLRHRFCGRCGAPTVVIEAGHACRCSACRTDVFPRTDPAIIVLVTRGERCVLGRSARFPGGMYSTLAGFVEPGESLEAALAREVFEEVGLEVESITYRSSQPWPFPQSLMLGFRAVARTEELNVELDELQDAQWFERARLRDPEARPVQLPNVDSIARFLIEEWLAEAT
jgi:NAD+ diphosphatase